MAFTVAILGLGQVGLTYDLNGGHTISCLSHSQAFAMHPQFSLIAGVDLRPESRALFENRYGANTFDSVEELVSPSTRSIDVVVIATPTETHLDLLERVTRLITPRLVLLEKPAARDSAAGRAMEALAEHCRQTVVLNYPRRVTPGSVLMRDQFEARRGQLHHATCRYGGELMTQGIHMIDLCEFWFGDLQSAEVTDVLHYTSPSVSAVFERGTAKLLSTGLSQDGQTIEYSAHVSAPEHEWTFDLGRDRQVRRRTRSASEASAMEVPVGFEMYQYWVANEVAKLLESGTSNLADLHSGLRHVEIIDGLVERGSWP